MKRVTEIATHSQELVVYSNLPELQMTLNNKPVMLLSSGNGKFIFKTSFTPGKNILVCTSPDKN
jgi:hypothetical protein